jgi:hypothetical protein
VIYVRVRFSGVAVLSLIIIVSFGSVPYPYGVVRLVGGFSASCFTVI